MSDRQRSAIRTVVIVIAVIVGLMGLLLVAAAILFSMAMSNYGSNK